MQFHEFFRPFDSLLLGLKVEDCEPTDDLFTFRERAINCCALAVGNTNLGAGGNRRESTSGYHSAGSVGFGGKLLHRIHQSLWRRPGKLLSVLDQHHESHLFVSFCTYVALTIVCYITSARPLKMSVLFMRRTRTPEIDTIRNYFFDSSWLPRWRCRSMASLGAKSSSSKN